VEDLLPDPERYSIRAFRAQDKEALFELMYEFWPGTSREKLEKRWWWHYDPPAILLVVDNETGAFVGLMAYIPFQLYDGDANRRSAWIVDGYLLPEHQRRGIGTCLFIDITDRHEVVASLSQSEAAWRNLQKLGWQERRYVPLFLSPWLTLTRPFSRFLPSARGGDGLEVTAHELSFAGQFDASFDDLWLRARDRVAPCAVRDASALAQRYAREPQRGYTVLKSSKGDMLAGYMILRVLPPGTIKSLPKFRTGVVVDYLTDGDPMVFGHLLSAAATRFAKCGASLILCMASRRDEQRQLQKRGFFGPKTPLVKYKLKGVGFTYLSTVEGSLDTRPWHLTVGDCDMELIW
jgi:GNAT superfamily N-acetyltransferase